MLGKCNLGFRVIDAENVGYERFIAATRAAAAVARQREEDRLREDVLCRVASQLALFTAAIPVLQLCRGQDRS